MDTKILNNLIKKNKPLIKSNIKGKKTSTGRNSFGKITIRHKGGGHKKRYRKIKFNMYNNSLGIVCNIEYDPNRTAYIAAIFNFYVNNFYYMLSPKKLKTGDIVKSSLNSEPKLGHSLPMSNIPVGSYIFNISVEPYKHGQISRAAGTFAILKEKTLNYVVVKLNSGKHKTISSKCYATVGIVSNETFFLTKINKAGHSRWKNKRPTVRGVAMNPVDHPHGGGEGKKSGKNKTPWGKTNK